MARLLLVHHTVSPATHALTDAVRSGATDPSIDGVDLVVRPALTASPADALAADGYLLGSPVNLGSISGALKHFFDQAYYPCLDATAGRPYGVYLHGQGDAAGALRMLEPITTGLRWRAARPPLVVVGEPGRPELDAAWELGATLAALLADGG